jgi:serine/threonine-protein kinase
MGEVYRAKDTRLGRDVAIKVLPDDFTSDPERMARLRREARVLASLNHPCVAGIHQLEEVEGRQFLVMELVDGEDLSSMLVGGAIQPEEVIRLGIQIASGLEAAHDRGIVHRDLKPANIKVTPEGQAKILDFGLAKRSVGVGMEPDGSPESPTLTAQMTQAGAILGTARYMSPEQARGEATDQRTDVWSLGVVLYEMLTGGSLFAEQTASETLAAVLRAEIDWSRLPPETPGRLCRLLRRCLQREPRHRLHAIADARIELEAPEDEGSLIVPESALGARAWGWVLAGALGGALVAGAMALLLGGPTRELESAWPLRSLQVVDGVGVDFFNVHSGLNASEPRVSPDGSMVVYPFGGRLWIRDMNRLEPRAIAGTDGARDAFCSPDGKELAYVVGSELRRVDAAGGPSTLLARLDAAYLGGTWGAGDRIVLALAGRGLYELPGRGGELRPLLQADAEAGDFDFHSPAFLGDGATVAFIPHERSAHVRSIDIFDGSERRKVYRTPNASRPTSLAFDASSGFLVFATIRANAGVWALPFDPDRTATEAEAQLLIPNGLAPSLATDGSLVYVDGLRAEPYRFARIDRAGSVVGEVGQALWDQGFVTASPDGTRVAAIATDSGAREIWVHDLKRDTALRVNAERPDLTTAAWADAGESIVYATSAGGTSRLVKQRADGSGTPTVLIEGQVGRPSLPHDARFLVYQVNGARLRRGPGDLWWFPIGQPGEAAPLVARPADEVQPAVSPDGRLLAYTSDESGRYEVYLTPLSGERSRLRVSVQGGEAPLWSRDGSELFYIEGSALIAVRVGSDGQPLGSPEQLFTQSEVSSPLVVNGTPMFTLGPDGDFLVIQNRIPGSPRVVAVENWKRMLED